MGKQLIFFVKNTALAFVLLALANTAKAQITLSTPGTTGDYTNNVSITLAPPFSSTGPFTATIQAVDCSPLPNMPSINQNYTITNTPRMKGILNETQLAGRNTCEIMQSIQYVDGLGRTKQTIQVMGSPLGKDIVVPSEYDNYSREIKKYLPYVPTTGIAGAYRSDALSSAQAGFYNVPPDGVVNIPSATQIAYAETRSESSPLNRTLEQGAPGLSWKIGGGHTISYSYAVNNSTDAVKLWVVNTAGGASFTSNYSPGSLYKTIETDENQNTIIEFKDIDGTLICRKVLAGAGSYITTDYVYDDIHHLRYVIPPLPSASGTNPAVSVPTNFTETNNVFLNFFYGYHYDDLNRLIEKKIPGKDWEYIVYNNNDLPIMSQDANQRLKGIWMVNKFDALGRVTMTGEVTNASSRLSVQNSADASINLSEKFTNANTNYGYTHLTYPDISSGTGNKILTVTYYDDYSVISNNTVNPSSTIFQAPPSTIDSLDQKPRGMPIATLINVLGTNYYLFNLNYYNKDGKLVKLIAQHFQGATSAYNKYDTKENQYSFQNAPTQSVRKHYLPTSPNPQLTVVTSQSYDHMNRLILTKQQFITPSATSSFFLSKNIYNELGQLMTKHLHSAATGSPANSSFLQHIDYRFNSRGWITRINNPESTGCADETYTNQLDAFAEKLDYDQLTNGFGGIPQYNGNISNVKWQTKLPSTITLTQEYKGYVFTYDPLNRLTNAAFKAQTTANNSSYDESVNYDELGNVAFLTRKNGTGFQNNLTYNYTAAGIRSNKLWSVADAGQEAYNSNYTYDVNGNQISDSHKTVSSINYNELNLPSTINITASSKTLVYRYDATGKKLERLTGNGSTALEDRFYDDGIEYAGNNIVFVKTPEGRALPSTNGYIPEYEIEDHLGNIRTLFGDKDNNGVLTAGEIIQTTDYYPFGRDISYTQNLVPNPDNSYKYNGKEFQVDLNEYDYGARLYDPVIGRWNTIDPLAEMNRRFNPYNYVENNPVNNIDPDGMEVVFGGGDQGGDLYTGEEAVLFAKGIQAYERKHGMARDATNTPGNSEQIKSFDYQNPVDHPSAYQSTVLAKASYGGYTGGLVGYSLGDPGIKDKNLILYDTESGFKSAFYVKTVNGVTSWVYAYAGTEDWTDWKNDFGQEIGIARQYNIAAKNADIIASYFKKVGEKVTFVGHSLGGGLAALSAMLTKFKAVTFNAAGVSAPTLLLHGLSPFRNYNNLIKAYVAAFDPLDKIQRSHPLLHTAQGYRVEVKAHSLRAIYDGHSIDGFIDAFKK